MGEAPRIGTYGWRQMMQWGWGIFKLKDNWYAFDTANKAAHHFDTHEAATDFVRSEIDKG